MSPSFEVAHPGERNEDEPRVEPCVECIPITVSRGDKCQLFIIGLQETKNMALALSFQPTLRLFFPEKRRHKRALELTGVVVV
jgi:hypothetical protein